MAEQTDALPPPPRLKACSLLSQDPDAWFIIPDLPLARAHEDTGVFNNPELQLSHFQAQDGGGRGSERRPS